MWYLPELIQRIATALGPDLPITTEIPSSQSAWLAIPVFEAAKKQKRLIPEVANEVAAKLTDIQGIQVTVMGGFVNVTPKNWATIIEQVARETPFSITTGRSVVIDYSSPNIAKPMSIGHLRSTIIGDSLRRLYESLGYTVISINHIGDWGTQFGKLLVAYRNHYGDLTPRPDLTMQDLLDLYVNFHTSAEHEPELDNDAREMFAKLEAGDVECRVLWQSLVEASLREFQAIYDRLGVVFTEPKMGESFFEDKLSDIIRLAKERGLAEESDGALVIHLPNQKVPLLLRKQDGATLYATRDLAALKYRVETYQPQALLYVVANEQALHFEQLFTAARLMDLAPKPLRLEHVKFGLLLGSDGKKMSTRRGRVIFLQDVFDEAVRRAMEIIEEKNPDLSPEEKQKISEVVGIGALKYFDLSHDRKHDIVFDWDRMLQLKGDSGPYLQYAHVRASQILHKAGVSDVANSTPIQYPDSLPIDISDLLRELARLPLVVERSALDTAPHILAQYLNDVAVRFSRFYENYPVLKAEGDERAFRLMVVAGVARTLKRGLELLGIDAPERL